MRALIYTRVSQDRAQGRSVDEQETEARALCERAGWTVVDVITDSVGASRHSKGKRDGWSEVKRRVAVGDADVLVTWAASRAQRDLAAYAELRDLCAANRVLWSYSGRTYNLTEGDDRFRTGLDALIAEREVEVDRDAILRAMRANAAAGRPHGKIPYGYRRIYDPVTRVLIRQEADPDTAPVIARMFAEYLAGTSMHAIARGLNADGHRTKTGALWVDAQVRRMIDNPLYAGMRRHHGQITAEGTWPAIIDRVTWERARARRDSMPGRGIRQTGTARLLTGVGRCGRCGGKVFAGHDRNHRKVYLCRTGFHVARDMIKLDAHVTAAVLERLRRADVVASLGGDAPPLALVEAQQAVAVLHQRLDAAVAAYTSGTISITLLAKAEAELRPQIATAEGRARRTVLPIELDVPADVEAWWTNLAGEQRREVVAALISAVVIGPTVRGRKAFDPEAISIEWRRVTAAP